MKKLCTGIALLLSITGFAQNVGIGETNPAESKLQVKNTDSAVLLIQNTATPNGTKTGLFYKSDGNYSGGIATVKTAPVTYRMGLFTFGGSTASSLIERVSILDGGNVGIGTTNPSAKLDVAGTVKIADGTQGADKVLTSDAAGNATWQSLGSKLGYKYCRQITGGFGTFTIPAGVTEVMVELWGAGSGGVTTSTSVSAAIQGRYFGGTSGGYASTVQTVTPGSGLTYSVGSGSADNVLTSTIADGGSTTVVFASGNIVALGGKGHMANSYEPGASQSGSSTLANFIVLPGNVGSYPTFKTELTSSTEYWKILTAGNGGTAPGLFNYNTQKGATQYFLNGTFLFDNQEPSSSAVLPGSGGGSDDKGNSGGNGMILIWYN